MSAREFGLDYFQLYDIENPQLVQESVTLKGQFDKEPERGRLRRLNRFANPVSKNGEPILDKYAHLTSYFLHDPTSEPKRVVIFSNQFGREQKIVTYSTIALLAPARKIERGSKFPEKLDHYKVYRVIDGDPVGKEVKLEDQFASREAKVTYPIAFAVPVKKEHEGKTFPIHNEKAHLVFYRITPSENIPKSIKAYDQFGRYYLKIGVSYLLGVPSMKVDWKELD